MEGKVIQCKDRRDYAKFVKRTIPAFIHSVDQTRSSAWKQPIVLRHKLHPFLQCSYDSPLVTIHHQLEITFQFDHRFEDIKAKIPIIIASIPSSSSSNDNNKKSNPLPLIFSEQWLTHFNSSNNNSIDTKYPFETITRFESMNVIPEVNDRSVPRTSEDSTARYAVSSVLIDPNMTQLDFHSNNHLLPSITNLRKQQDKQHQQQKDHQKIEKEDDKIEKDIPIWKSALPPPPTTNQNSNKKSTHPRNNNIINNNNNNHLHHGYHYYQQKHQHPEIYNRCTSALDFNTYEQQQQHQQRIHQQQFMLPDERPRTTTPLQRRQDKIGNGGARRRRKLPPIDVELANGLKPKIKIIVDSSCQKTDNSSEVLPESDRDIISNKSNQQQQRNNNELMEDDDLIYDNDDDNDLEVEVVIEGEDDIEMEVGDDLEVDDDDDDPLENDPFDFQSVYSDLSLGSHGAPSLSSSATEASIGSHHTLLTRPPSPAFRPAPGLPANIALRSHDDERPTALVEESFEYAAITSPAIATVASSVILSPCQSSSTSTTTSSNRRRIALSSVSSIMNSVASGHSGSQHLNHHQQINNNHDALSFRSFGGPFNSNGTTTTISSFHTAPTSQPSSNHNDGIGSNNSSGIIPINNNNKFLLTPHGSIRDSLAVDPDNMDLIQQSASSPNSINTIEVKQHYLYAKLPPIPTNLNHHQKQEKEENEKENEIINNDFNSSSSISSLPNSNTNDNTYNNGVIPRRRKNQNNNENINNNENTTKRMTRLYTDDSDDETLDPLPPIPEKHIINNTSTIFTHPPLPSSSPSSPSSSNSNANAPLILSSGPPQLPRLSFGIALGDALGLDQFKKKF